MTINLDNVILIGQTTYRAEWHGCMSESHYVLVCMPSGHILDFPSKGLSILKQRHFSLLQRRVGLTLLNLSNWRISLPHIW